VRPRQLKRYTASQKTMQRLSKILMSVALVAVSISGLAAQDSRSQPKLTTQHTNENGTSITTIKLEPILIQHDDATKPYTLLSAWVAYDANSTKSKSIALSFHSRSPDCRFSNESNLLLILDNDQITLTHGAKEPGDGALWVFGEREGKLCNESCSVVLSEQTFRRVTTSKHVEARLGSVTFLLDDAALKALRYFAGHITNGAV
jgi:hypothetical protein